MSGYNTQHGFDQGPPPPYFPPTQAPGIPQYPPFFGSHSQRQPQLQAQPFFGAPQPQPTYGFPTMQYPMMAPQLQHAIPAHPQYPYTPQTQTHPAPPPLTNHGFPTVHLYNGTGAKGPYTGGVGLPPGYDYAFPAEHTKIHVFKTKDPPWQSTTRLHAWDANTHVKLFVPTTVTLKELMKGLGCNNEEAKKNVVYELTEGGNGRWLRGMTAKGDDKDKMKMPIHEMGWDKTRTGNPGERPVVWLWLTKD